MAGRGLLLGVIAGPDARDATASSHPVPDYVAGLDRPIAGLRIGMPDRYYEEGVDDVVRMAVQAATEALRGLGAEVVECPLPDPAPLNDLANMIARCESTAVHGRIVRESPHLLQPAVRARLEVGFHVSAHDYLQAARLRARATRTSWTTCSRGSTSWSPPRSPSPRRPWRPRRPGHPDDIVRRMGRFSRLTRPWNALGLPALSLPCGFAADGRPVGLQLIARPFDEATLLRAGHAYEQAAGWWRRRPPLA